MFGRDDSYSYFSDESNTKTIDVVTPDRLLDNSVSLEPLYVSFYAESLQKDNREIIALRKVYTPPVWDTLKESEAI